MEWPVKRRYIGLVAVGVQEQAEDILVPPLLRNCLTVITFPSPSHYLPSRTVVLAIVFTVYATLKMSMMTMMVNNFESLPAIFTWVMCMYVVGFCLSIIRTERPLTKTLDTVEPA